MPSARGTAARLTYLAAVVTSRVWRPNSGSVMVVIVRRLTLVVMMMVVMMPVLLLISVVLRGAVINDNINCRLATVC